MNPADGVRRPLSAKFRMGVSLGPPILSSSSVVNLPPPSSSSSPREKVAAIKPLERTAVPNNFIDLPVNATRYSSHPTHNESIINTLHNSRGNGEEKERRYGGAIVRVSELQRQRGGALPPASLLCGGPSSSISLLSPLEAPHTAPVEDKKEWKESGKEAKQSDGADPIRKSRRAGSPPSRKNPKARRRGLSTSGRSRSSSFSLSLRADGRPLEYRWFTARGRRQLVHDGKTYVGRKAHRMWTELKRIESNAGGLGMESARTRASTRVSKRPKKEGVQPERSRGRVVLSREIPPTPTSPPSSEWRELFKDIDLDDDDGLVEDSNSSPLDVPLARPKPAHPARCFAVKQPIKAPSPVGPPPRPPQPSPSSFSFTKQTKIVEMIEDDEEGEGEGPSRGENSANVKAPPLTGAPPSGMEWPISYFSSDSHSSSGYDEEDEEESITDDEHGKFGSPKVQAVEEDYPLGKGEDRNSTQQKQSEVGACSSPSSIARVNYKGVEVVEHDGWLYPVELLNSIQNGNKLSLESPPKREKSCVSYSSTAKGGLAVIGVPNPKRRTLLKMPLHETNKALAPILDRYEEAGSVFECLNSNDMEGLFDAGEEIGGFRFSR